MPPPVCLIASTALEDNAQYSPDGTRIAFASNRSGNPEIWVCGSDGAHCTQMTAFNGPFITGTPRWSPDGKRIAFDSAKDGHFGIYVVDGNGGSPRRLTDASTTGSIPSWSRDGKWIYFSSGSTGRSEIWKIPNAGGAAHQVTHNGGFVAFESPDGKALYYTKTQQDATLWRSGLDGSGETEVLNGVASRAFVVTSDRVYYLRHEPGGASAIRRFVFATGDDAPIALRAAPVRHGLSLSPVGKYLIYSQVDRLESNLMLVENFH